MASYPTTRTPEDIAALKANLREPGFVAMWLDELQREALAGLVQHPELARLASAHLFASPEPFYLACFQAIRSGAVALPDIYDAMLRKLPAHLWEAESLVNLENAWASRPATIVALDRLTRFVAWQYRRELAKRKASA